MSASVRGRGRAGARLAAWATSLGWRHLAAGCLLWAAWSELYLWLGLPTREPAAAALLWAATTLLLARGTAARAGAEPREHGRILAAVASLACGAAVVAASHALLAAAPRWLEPSYGVTPWRDGAACLALAAAGQAVALRVGWRARVRARGLLLSLLACLVAPGPFLWWAVPLCGLVPPACSPSAASSLAFAMVWAVSQPLRLHAAPPGPRRDPEERWGPL